MKLPYPSVGAVERILLDAEFLFHPHARLGLPIVVFIVTWIHIKMNIENTSNKAKRLTFESPVMNCMREIVSIDIILEVGDQLVEVTRVGLE